MKAKKSKGFKNILLPLMMLAMTVAQPVYSAIQAPSSQVIRVGISNTAFSSWVRNTVEIYGTEEVNIYDRSSKVLIKKVPAQENIKITMVNGNLYIEGDKKIPISEVVITSPNGLLGIRDLIRKDKPALYHGAFEIVKRDEVFFHVVNLIELEEYLKGVVPNEMPIKFGLEALKAQAVAARNYAITPRVKSSPAYDLVDSVASQVYFGANTEESISTRAVLETEGLVALYDWELILALYSSTAGGYTESYSNAFSETLTKDFPSKGKPYLMAKPDMISQLSLKTEEDAKNYYKSFPDAYDMKSPYFRWQKKWTSTELEKELKNTLKVHSSTGFVKPTYNGEDEIGALKEIKVHKRGDSGKIIEMELIFEKENFTVQKELVIRRVMTCQGKALPSANVVFEHIFDQEGALSDIIAYGGGYGHGVGMSQYGAGFMGKNLDKKFDEILQHYYNGVSISTAPVTVDANNNVIRQTFYTDKKSAKLIIDNKFQAESVNVTINGKDYTFVLTPSHIKRYETVDISNYITIGHNSIIYYYTGNPKKEMKLYVELVPKNERY